MTIKRRLTLLIAGHQNAMNSLAGVSGSQCLAEPTLMALARTSQSGIND
jgi:hypothetical protein